MDFGSLQTVTAWRLCRTAETRCQGIVVHGPGGFRLVVVENQQIVEWTRVDTAAALWKHVRTTFRRLRKAGWHPHCPSPGAPRADTTGPALSIGMSRPSRDRRALLRIAEQTLS